MIISNVAPNHGPATGGSVVTIFGNGFLGADHVDFGGVASPRVTVWSDTVMEAVTPPWPGRGTGSGANPLVVSVMLPDQSGATWMGWKYTTWMPVPAGRGRWRITLHNRHFTDTFYEYSMIAELTSARSRRLEQTLNSPAQLQVTLDGRSDEAALVRELQTDLWAWRWDEATGRDVPYFQGIITQAEDQLTEQAYTLNLTAHDYVSMLSRRYTTRTLNFAQADQDDIALALVNEAEAIRSTDGATSFSPGSYLPMNVATVAGDGSQRFPASGVARDRTYVGSTEIGTALDQLAHVINGFDYDVIPGTRLSLQSGATRYGLLRIFYPSQGQPRSVVLEYGATVATVARTVTSTDYANFIRALGNNGDPNPAAGQLYSERWNSDANNVTVTPVGLWMDAPNGAADISVQTTLDQTAAGALNYAGVLLPTYALGLAPGVYTEGLFMMGDTLPVVIQAGRLNVSGTTVRIVGIAFDVLDDGGEDVSITVGRPTTSLADMLTDTQRELDALARR